MEPKNDQMIPLSAVLAILGLKIKAVDIQLSLFPESQYLNGQRDALVNTIEAFKKASG